MSIKLVVQAAELRLDPIPKLVLMALADESRDDGGVVAPGIEKVMAWSGASRSSVFRAIDTLAALGLVRKASAGRRGHRAEYVVFPSPATPEIGSHAGTNEVRVPIGSQQGPTAMTPLPQLPNSLDRTTSHSSSPVVAGAAGADEQMVEADRMEALIRLDGYGVRPKDASRVVEFLRRAADQWLTYSQAADLVEVILSWSKAEVLKPAAYVIKSCQNDAGKIADLAMQFDWQVAA